jgi:glutaminyl-tRNA synthetase
MGCRDLPLTREIFVERGDFMLEPAPDFFRLSVGRAARLRWGGFIACHEAVLDSSGAVAELRATFSDEAPAASGKRRPAIIHWVSAPRSVPATVRLYDRLFLNPRPSGDLSDLNPGSLVERPGARLEMGLAEAKPGDRFQFERLGYFFRDRDVLGGEPVFNRTVTLKDGWARRAVRDGGR